MVAAGCGDRQRIAETWSFLDYQDMRAVWDEIAPPAYISLAAMIAYKPKPPKRTAEGAAESAQTPEEFAQAMREFFGSKSSI